MPIIIASIQTYTALEETLVILLNALGPLRSLSPRLDLSEALVTPLIHVLPPLAGVHPDPSIRHIIFRLLSLILSYTPSPLRFQLLQDLITDPDVTPQMRVAAIGLVKEAVLENLSASKSSLGGEQLETAFTSPNFMQMFSPIIFKLDLPQAAGQEDLDLQEFLESPEPLRLVEGLGLYYVVLQRDVDNRTGIRDPDSMRVIDKELLTVLRQQLTKWNEDLNETPDTAELLANHNALQLGILEMWLDRIQSATAAL
ncbi:hypothetical protein EW026_g6682 [Hermanssonia centrifuga]|uniref:Uncharacterized protein n=1 Tax=Hermanssonia centrifuga TaxID=98765 RepID=A0A4S4KA77_9APHY|nr:hypothetical protein EW026_g6682 [Hermanssonia centrifuga]